MGFTHIQGISNNGIGVTTLALTLGSNPTAGNIVCVGFCPGAAVTAFTCKDSNNNSYTVTPNSPSTNISGAGQVWLAYLLSAPANATKSLTLAWTTTAGVAAWADEFHVSGGTAAFDKDIAAGTSTAGTTINTPSISPTGAGELLFAAASAGGSISAPASGATLGVWTGSGGAITTGDMAEYDLSAGSATAVQFTQSSGGWSAMAMAFSFTASGFTPDEDFWQSTTPAPTDPDITVWQ